MEHLCSHWTDFNEIWSSGIFRRCVGKIQVSLKSDKNNRYFTWSPVYIYDISFIYSLNEMFQAICLEKIETHFTFQLLMFGKSWLLWDNMEKYGRNRQHTNDNTIRRMCIACWITKTTDTHTPTHTHTHTHTQNMKHLLLFHGSSGYANAPYCYLYIYAARFLRLFARRLEAFRILFLTGFPTKNVHALYSFPYVPLVPPFTLDLSLQNAL
jgi:hypothetical protein